MKNKTFDILNQMIVRLQTILEVDDELEEWQKKGIKRMLLILSGLLAGTDEKPSE